eukprot:scaffold12087_cov73-Skeletonema_dohrnii-CCMP3373.AAC.4
MSSGKDLEANLIPLWSTLTTWNIDRRTNQNDRKGIQPGRVGVTIIDITLQLKLKPSLSFTSP